MKQSNVVKVYEAVWARTPVNFSENSSTPPTVKVEEFLGSIFTSGPYYYYIVDFGNYPKYDVPYVHQSTLDYYGLKQDEFTVQTMLESIHPDDIEFGAACEATIMKFYSTIIAPEEKVHYKKSYCFRVKDSFGSYNLIQHQAIVLTFASHLGIGYCLNLHTRIDHLTKVNPGTISFIGLNGRKSYLNIDPFSPIFAPKAIPHYTKREKEVIRLSSEGLSSKEIATSLQISLETVWRHRKNLLTKHGCGNMSEVVALCIRSGIL